MNRLFSLMFSRELRTMQTKRCHLKLPKNKNLQIRDYFLVRMEIRIRYFR